MMLVSLQQYILASTFLTNADPKPVYRGASATRLHSRRILQRTMGRSSQPQSIRDDDGALHTYGRS